MNLKGSKMYSSATSSLRNTRNAKDLHLKLIFIYPMLLDTTLFKYQQTFRDYISNIFLRDIFTANFLNLVNLTDQISPIEDENGNKVDLGTELGSVLIGGQGGMGRGRNNFFNLYNEKRITKEELQQRIKEKTKQLESILKSDPIFKTLNPKIQYVTLDNLIDVPVIVGTKAFPVDTFTLSMFLFFSIVLRIPIDSYENVKRIISKIRSTDRDKLVKLLNFDREKSNGWLYRILQNSKDYLKKKVSKVVPRNVQKIFRRNPENEFNFGNDEKELFILLDGFFDKLDYKVLTIFIQSHDCITNQKICNYHDIQGDIIITPKKYIWIDNDNTNNNRHKFSNSWSNRLYRSQKNKRCKV